LDAECFSFAALAGTWKEAKGRADREHVTPYIWRTPGRFRLGALKAKRDYSHLRWTVDNEADFQFVSQMYEALFREDEPFLMSDILNYLGCHPELTKANQAFIGKEGYEKLWRPT
jgi:spore coat polysaccharide biosynthesis protein SpsF